MSPQAAVGEPAGFVVDFEFVHPEQWMGWVPGASVDTVANSIAAVLAAEGAARIVTSRSIALINAESVKKGGVVAYNAVWVPDRSIGEVAAVLDVTVVPARGGGQAPARHLGRNRRRAFGWTTRIMEYAARISEVPAGRVTIEQVLLRRFGERTVQAYLFLNVYPPGAHEAASLVFNTVHLDLVPELARQARMIAESLKLTLGDIPGGRPRR